MNEEYLPLVKEILNDAYVVALGTVDERGPWIANVIFVYDDVCNLYWMSEMKTRHSEAVAQDPRTAASVTASVESKKERALQMEGTTQKIEGRMYELEERLYAKIGKPVPPKLEDKFVTGYSWYKFTPTRIELIHNEQFGWGRQRVL